MMRKWWPSIGLIVLVGLGLGGCAASNAQPTPNAQSRRSSFKAIAGMVVGITPASTGQEAATTLQPIPTPIPPAPMEPPLPESVPPDGVLVPDDPRQPTETPLPDDAIPESLPITKLVPFIHESTGISGLRPDNWTLFEGDESFQISSHPNAPDGFIGTVKYGSSDNMKLVSVMFFDQTKSSASDLGGEVLEEHRDENGNGTLLLRTISNAQGSSKLTEMIAYIRITHTENRLLIGMAAVPSELFPQQEQFIREMVDSLTLE